MSHIPQNIVPNVYTAKYIQLYLGVLRCCRYNLRVVKTESNICLLVCLFGCLLKIIENKQP